MPDRSTEGIVCGTIGAEYFTAVILLIIVSSISTLSCLRFCIRSMPRLIKKYIIWMKRFEEAKRKIIGVDRQRLGIGTLSEKTVHAIFKDYYEPDEDHQEIPIENYVADIYRDGEIIEIQTRQFNRMRENCRPFFLYIL